MSREGGGARGVKPGSSPHPDMTEQSLCWAQRDASTPRWARRTGKHLVRNPSKRDPYPSGTVAGSEIQAVWP